MNTKLFLISVCLGGAIVPTQIHTDKPTQTIFELVESGEKVSNVTISNVK